jgi:hypothetical protein
MLWSEIKKWAKDKGYETLKDKEDNQYYWAKIDDPNNVQASGVASSVSKLAKAIYNHISENKWVEYQKEYKESVESKVHDQGIADY